MERGECQIRWKFDLGIERSNYTIARTWSAEQPLEKRHKRIFNAISLHLARRLLIVGAMREARALYLTSHENLLETVDHDFAFADTVAARHESEERRISTDDEEIPFESSHEHEPLTSNAWLRAWHYIRSTQKELSQLWHATGAEEYAYEDPPASSMNPISHATRVGRRVRRFLDFFEWNSTDLVRAACLGIIVFVVTATLGTFVLQKRNAVDVVEPTSTRTLAL